MIARAVDPPVAQNWERVDGLDLEPFVSVVVESAGLALTEVDDAAECYRGLLKLAIKYRHNRITIPHKPGLILDAHLRDTIRWQTDCIMIAGQLIGHWPYGPAGAVGIQQSQEMCQTTRALFQKEFGTDLLAENGAVCGDMCCDGRYLQLDSDLLERTRPRPLRPLA